MTGPTTQLSLLEVISLGVGTMIGAGIFALFGEISTLAGGYAWVAFLIAGFVSGLAGYSYYVLSTLSSTNGGIAEYLTHGWRGSLVGSATSFCYFLSIAIVLGLVAESFGQYAVQIFHLGNGSLNALAIAVILAFILVNAAGVKLVGVAEKILVLAKLAVLCAFTLVAFTQFNTATYAANSQAVGFQFGNFVNAVVLANLSFAGFAVIANTGGSVASKTVIARAIAIAIGLVGIVYIALDLSVFGSIPLAKIESAKDYALAAAAQPTLGAIGFTIVGITAMISTMTNINANIFSGANVIAYLGQTKEVSAQFARRIFFAEGNIAMLAIAAIVIALIVTLDLSQIGDVAGATFLLVHTLIPLGAALHCREETGTSGILLWLAVIFNGGLLAFFLWHLARSQGVELYVFAGTIAFAVLFTMLSRFLLGRQQV